MLRILIILTLLLSALSARGDDSGVLRGYQLFREAEALREAGEPAKALAKYDALFAADPRTRFHAQAKLGRARCLAATGDRPAARKALGELEAEAVPRKLEPALVEAASLLHAELLEADGEVQPAIERWTSLRASKDPVLAARAAIAVE
ncbi:MAG TPA: tetratricopeptide repeat protein, partial [Planctomycetota bacterium]|nr:tetratricopeptide repeat protein [Planctomycetota bacterium]